MCVPCKIIINGGFMATLAPTLAARFDHEPNRRAHITNLATAARTAVEMLATIGIKADSDHLERCEQAQSLVAWITDPKETDFVKIKVWTAELWAVIADLAAGKLR